MSATHVGNMREDGLLPRRRKIDPGSRGRKGTPRYRFIEIVAADMARTSIREFGWPDSDVQRMVEIITSGNEAAVRASELVVVEGVMPGAARVQFLAFDELDVIDANGNWQSPRGSVRVLQRTSLIEAVEAVANALHDRMSALGFEFDAAAPKAPKHRTNVRGDAGAASRE